MRLKRFTGLLEIAAFIRGPRAAIARPGAPGSIAERFGGRRRGAPRANYSRLRAGQMLEIMGEVGTDGRAEKYGWICIILAHTYMPEMRMITCIYIFVQLQGY